MIYVRKWRHHFFWGHKANDTHTTVKHCRSFAQDGSQTMHKCKLQLFPAAGPLKFMAINILEPLPKTPLGGQHFFTMTDRYSNLTSALLRGKITLTPFATTILDNWILLHGIPNYVLIYNSPQFVRKLFKTFCLSSSVEKLTTPPTRHKETVKSSYISGHLSRESVIMFMGIRSIVIHTYNRSLIEKTRWRIEREEHPPTTWYFLANRHLQQHLTDWPALLTICRDTWHHDVCQTNFYSVLSWWKLQPQSYCLQPDGATNGLL